jgi:hypothetical protein
MRARRIGKTTPVAIWPTPSSPDKLKLTAHSIIYYFLRFLTPAIGSVTEIIYNIGSYVQYELVDE